MATEAGRAEDGDEYDDQMEELRGTDYAVKTEGHSFVYFKFSLETTGDEQTPHMIKIAACRHNEVENRRAWQSLQIRPALEEFLDFLGNEQVVLCGFNLNVFHYSRLLTALQACNLVDQFDGAVHGFVDTLPLFRKINREVENHALSTLYTYYTGQVLPRAHAGMEDVRALKRIVDDANPGHMCFDEYSFNLDDVRHYQRERQERQASPWTELVNRGVITKYIRDKLVKYDLFLDEVRQAERTEGEEDNPVMVMLEQRLQKHHIADIVGYLHDNP